MKQKLNGLTYWWEDRDLSYIDGDGMDETMPFYTVQNITLVTKQYKNAM